MATASEAMDCDAPDYQQQNIHEGQSGIEVPPQNFSNYDHIQESQQQFVTVKTEEGTFKLTQDQYDQYMQQQFQQGMTPDYGRNGVATHEVRQGSAGSRSGSAGQRYPQHSNPSQPAMSSSEANDERTFLAPNVSVSQRQRTNENPFARLGNFEVQRKIGRGQFSVVYRAKCKLNEMIVALKKVQVL